MHLRKKYVRITWPASCYWSSGAGTAGTYYFGLPSPMSCLAKLLWQQRKDMPWRLIVPVFLQSCLQAALIRLAGSCLACRTGCASSGIAQPCLVSWSYCLFCGHNPDTGLKPPATGYGRGPLGSRSWLYRLLTFEFSLDPIVWAETFF